MRKLLASGLILSVALLWGCGGNDNGTGGDGGETLQRLVANTTVTAPTFSSADETVWNSVDSVMVPVSQTNTPKIVPAGKITSLATEVKVQAIRKNDTLYVRLRWVDDSFDAWPDYYAVTDTTPVKLTRNTVEQEDQAYVMFDGAPGGGYDCWAWKVLRTGGAGMGMGYTYNNYTLTPDAAGSVALPIATSNPPDNTYISKDTSQFHSYILKLTDIVHLRDSLRVDTVIFGDPPETTYATRYFEDTRGWTIDQKVPGYVIDASVGGAAHTDAQRGSLLDIRAVDNYANNQYSLVLKRKMNTGYADDMDLTTVDSVKVEIAIFNNQNLFTTGGTRRGISNPFWIIF